MKFKICAALAALVVATAPIAPAVHANGTASGASDSDAAAFQALIQQGFAKIEARDWKSAKERFEAALKQPIFGKLPADMQYHVYLTTALAEMRSGDPDQAYQYMIDAGTVAPDARDEGYWGALCDVARQAKKPEALADAFMHIITEYPDMLAHLDSEYVAWIVHDIRGIKDGHTRLLTVLQALHDARYKPSDVFWNEWVDYSLMAVYVEKGDDVRAGALAATITDPASIKDMQIDRRYSRFVSPDGAVFVAAAEKDILRLKALAEANPDKIEGVQVLAHRLMNANHLPEALQRLDDALARVSVAPKDKPAFSDLDDHLNWVYDTRARVLRKMGRFDDGLAALKQGREVAEAAGQDVVSQKINLSDQLTIVGRARDALDEIRNFDPKSASPYGVMSAAEARACAYAQLGDAGHVKTELDYMKAHAKDGAGPLQSALLCAGDLDALAGQFIGRLDDPDERNSALGDVQTYLTPAAMTAWQKTIRDRYADILKRPDVKAAIDKYGFIRSYPVFGPEL